MTPKSLGPYKIVEPLGAGGMGEVYRAHDPRLDRDVALKVLPEELATPERVARFEREAKAVAALEHANIVTIHSVEEADGVRFLAMQLVEGRTLAEALPPGGLSLDRFFELAVPLVDAVGAAHDKGVVHRDLKPANVMVDDDGQVKVLDFGVAKLWEEPGAEDATGMPTAFATEEGAVVGTAAYMSPEQAEGKPLDHRTDVFSLGTILYEMVTGQRPFAGEGRISLLSAIVDEPHRSPGELKPQLPRHLGRIVDRCLEKSPDRRYQSAVDLRNDLEALRDELRGDRARPAPAAESADAKGPWWRWAAAALLVGVAVALAWWLVAGSGPDGDRARVGAVPRPMQLTDAPGRELSPSLSPDGERVAYAARKTSSDAMIGFWTAAYAPHRADMDVWVRAVANRTAQNLTADNAAFDGEPAISPDGDRIAFSSDRGGLGLYVMGIYGGPPTKIADRGRLPAWSPRGDRIAYSTRSYTFAEDRFRLDSEIWVVDYPAGDEPRRIAGPDAIEPAWSPDGRWIVYWGIDDRGLRDLWIVSSEGGEPRKLTDDLHVDASPTWSSDGWLYFLSNRGGVISELWRVRIDGDSGRLVGEPRLMRTPASYTGTPTVSADGRRIAYVARGANSEIQRIPLDPETLEPRGEPESLLEISRSIAGLDVSPAGDRLVFGTQTIGQEDLFVVGTDGTGFAELTHDPPRDRVPKWSSRGEIGYFSDSGGSWDLWAIDPGTRVRRQLTEAPDRVIGYLAWGPEGDRIAAFDFTRGRSLIFDPGVPWNEQEPLLLPPVDEDVGAPFQAYAWSPDGRWLGGFLPGTDGVYRLAIHSMESGSYRVVTETVESWIWLWFTGADGDPHVAFLRGGDAVQVNLEEEEPPRPFAAIPPEYLNTIGAVLAPDQRWLYRVDRSMLADVWLMTFTEDGP